MTTVDMTKPENRVVIALAHARRHKHHPDCRCRRYQGYCTPSHKMWCLAVDRELSTIHQERQT